MEKFIKIIDIFLLNYPNYSNGKYELECEYGDIIFFKNSRNPNVLIINGIYIKPEYRNQRFCKNIICYLINKCSNNFQYLCVESVISKILYDYLLRFTYQNKHFILRKNGFFYRL
jgi:hypothetical protein